MPFLPTGFGRIALIGRRAALKPPIRCPRLADVVPAFACHVELRQVPPTEHDGVAEQPHRRPRRIDLGAAGDECSEDVVLGRTPQRLQRNAALLGEGRVHGDNRRSLKPPVRTWRFFVEIAGFFGAGPLDLPCWLRLPLFPFWLLGYLGVGGVMGLLFLLRERHHVEDGQRWLWMTLLAGLAPVLLLKAPGYSQLFFLYNGQAALTVLGGAWFASRQEPQSPRRLTLALLTSALPVLLGSVADTIGRVKRDRRLRRPESALVTDYAQGFGWMRESTSPQATFVTRHRFPLVSAPGAWSVFFENDDFAVAEQRSRSREDTSIRRLLGAKIDSDPFLGHRRALSQLRSLLDLEFARKLRLLAPDADGIYLLIDSMVNEHQAWGPASFRVEALRDRERFEAHLLRERVFRNRATEIFPIKDRKLQRGEKRPVLGEQGRQ